MEKKQIAIGADIGGSHISCAAIDLSSHEIIENTYTVEEVDNHASADIIIDKWATAIQETVEKAGINEPIGIGFAMPGPFDYVDGIALFEGANEKFENLNRVNIAKKIKEKLNYKSEVAFRFMNDATAFAVGAVWADYSLSNKNVLAITLGTGFGSAFIEDTLPVLIGKKVPKLLKADLGVETTTQLECAEKRNEWLEVSLELQKKNLIIQLTSLGPRRLHKVQSSTQAICSYFRSN